MTECQRLNTSLSGNAYNSRDQTVGRESTTFVLPPNLTLPLTRNIRSIRMDKCINFGARYPSNNISHFPPRRTRRWYCSFCLGKQRLIFHTPINEQSNGKRVPRPRCPRTSKSSTQQRFHTFAHVYTRGKLAREHISLPFQLTRAIGQAAVVCRLSERCFSVQGTIMYRFMIVYLDE